MNDRYFIRLGEHTHEVRVEDGERQIFYEGVWLGADQLPSKLMEAGRIEDFITLIKYGHKVLTEGPAK